MRDAHRQPNKALRAARGAMTQGALADQVNAEIYRATGEVTVITAKSISDWERGWYTWPTADVRAALCRILGASDPVELGFYKRRVIRSSPEPSSVVLSDLIKSQAVVPTGASRVVELPAGRSFSGAELMLHHCVAEESGRGWLMIEPTEQLSTSLRRTDRWNAIVTSDAEGKYYVSDGRRFAPRRGRRTNRQPVASAHVIDELTTGIIWAVVNTDSALLADDAQLEVSQMRLAHYVEQPASEASMSEVPDLNPVASLWLGSTFCSRHISRHLGRLSETPFFWTREQRGEEASNWLLWNHKLDYLRYTSKRFTGIRRAFCVPEQEVQTSPRYERVLLLLTMALMEAFGITVELTTEPALGDIGGFVLADAAIEANWLGGDGIWRVDARPRPKRHSTYRDIARRLEGESVIACERSAGRLEATADYLGISWSWFRQRCEELAAAGIDGIAQPRSRHLSTRGLDTAIRYIAHIITIEGACLARC
ncbi:helix-turn-helix transcriptional regulator [Kribbella sp. NPDC023855]|uniref:helix-turn-helix domain-containing protein n=1 Tax=Kribbella sp. NPDC023855 TaxID=3154698 RepID=UPI0033F58F84